MIIPRDMLKRVYLVGNGLSHLPAGAESVGRLRELLDEALMLSAYAFAGELSAGFAELPGAPGDLDEAQRCLSGAQRELATVWSGDARTASDTAVAGLGARLAGIRAGIAEVTSGAGRFTTRVAEINKVIGDGRSRLAQAYELTPELMRLSESYEYRIQLDALFGKAQRAGVTGAGLVYRAYLEFDSASAELRNTLVAAQGRLAVPPAALA